MNAVKVGIVGASGYSGEELVRLLLRHPGAELAAVTSRQFAGQAVARIFPKFAHLPLAKTLRFSEPRPELLAKAAQIIFLALPHGVAAEYAAPLLDLGCQVIDLSADFRLKSPDTYKAFYGHDHPAPDLLKKSVYGLPEIHRARLHASRSSPSFTTRRQPTRRKRPPQPSYFTRGHRAGRDKCTRNGPAQGAKGAGGLGSCNVSRHQRDRGAAFQAGADGAVCGEVCSYTFRRPRRRDQSYQMPGPGLPD
jgi:hypothetical protein